MANHRLQRKLILDCFAALRELCVLQLVELEDLDHRYPYSFKSPVFFG
jgi:hypothetical protein